MEQTNYGHVTPCQEYEPGFVVQGNLVDEGARFRRSAIVDNFAEQVARRAEGCAYLMDEDVQEISRRCV